MISDERDNEVLQIHTDHLGTPRVVTDSNNATVWKWEGDAFGSQSPQVETVKMPLRHAGQYNDTETGLFYNYFRYYDPKTGRYVTSDPIGLEGGLNTFGYVGSNPLHKIDPRGLVEWKGKQFTVELEVRGGASYEIFTLYSPCPNGGQAMARVVAFSGTAGISLPMTISGNSTTTFYDDNNFPDPDVFNGLYIKAGMALSWGIGAGTSTIIMGGAKSMPQGFHFLPKPSIQGGVEAGMGANVGLAGIISKKECEECKL